MNYRYLEESDFDAIYNTFVKAFSDYQVRMKITKAQFREMNDRRGLNYGLSVGAFNQDGLMVGLLLSGVDTWKNKRTAYDLGTGVVPEFRRKGVADSMFDFLLPELRKRGVEQYLLEVIKSNKKAYNLYKKKGFREIRQLECFSADTSSPNLSRAAKVDTVIEQMEVPDWPLFESFWDWQPSWQNSTNSMKRCPDKKLILGAISDNECVGYAILYPESGDITQIAVDKGQRRQGIGSQLVKRLVEETHKGRLAILNVDNAATGTIDFLMRMGFKNFIGQHEMMLNV
ncbi:MAG: GNAT family N-acetyltransferase [Candidatus Bathyarchaeota archaeon]|nr:MAG: GNAT family N-acetyltransferase [Candidatus Bathyarchaeota archaeon]